MTNEKIITRLADESVQGFRGVAQGEFVEDCEIKLQGFKGSFLQGGFSNIVKAEGLAHAYYCDYESELVGVKLKDLTHKADADMSAFTDGDINEFEAKFDGANVIVKRVNGKACVFANYSLLVYNPKL